MSVVVAVLLLARTPKHENHDTIDYYVAEDKTVKEIVIVRNVTFSNSDVILNHIFIFIFMGGVETSSINTDNDRITEKQSKKGVQKEGKTTKTEVTDDDNS